MTFLVILSMIFSTFGRNIECIIIFYGIHVVEIEQKNSDNLTNFKISTAWTD